MTEQEIIDDLAETIASEYVGDGDVVFQIEYSDAVRIARRIYEDMSKLKLLKEKIR